MLHTFTLLILSKGLNPPISKGHCGCTSFHEYVITVQWGSEYQTNLVFEW